MKQIICCLVALCFSVLAFCQDITGLWQGTLFNDSTKQSLEYEMLITKEKGKLIAFSHTWFLIDNKKYYGIKKVNVRLTKDGKIILQDAKLIDNNYPVSPLKDVYQLNILDRSNNAHEPALNGRFVTNRTKVYSELTGQVKLIKVSNYGQSDLLTYLQKKSKEMYVDIAVAR